MQVSVADPTTQTALTTPGPIGCDYHLSAAVNVTVVHVKLERLSLMGFDHSVQILGLI